MIFILALISHIFSTGSCFSRMEIWQLCFQSTGPNWLEMFVFFTRGDSNKLKLGTLKSYIIRQLHSAKLILECSLAEKQGLPILKEHSDPFSVYNSQHWDTNQYLCQHHTHNVAYTMTIPHHKSRDPSSCFNSVANIPHWHTKWPDGRLTSPAYHKANMEDNTLQHRLIQD